MIALGLSIGILIGIFIGYVLAIVPQLLIIYAADQEKRMKFYENMEE